MTELSRAEQDVLLERRRQVDELGWTAEHDDEHCTFELSAAASCYAECPSRRMIVEPMSMPRHWPWGIKAWKPEGDRSDLVRAAALLIAEIERLDRAAILLKGE